MARMLKWLRTIVSMQSQPPPEEEVSIKEEVLDFIFEAGKAATARQLDDATALDNKVAPVFATATVIVGLGGFSGTAYTPLLISAVGVYVLTALCALKALRLSKYRVTDSPRQLLDNYWESPLPVTKHAMVTDMAAGFTENEKALGKKRRWVLAVMFLTALETALVGSAVIWTLVT